MNKEVLAEATYLPEDILVAAVQCADSARQHDEMIPHDKVYSILSKRMGWKKGLREAL